MGFSMHCSLRSSVGYSVSASLNASLCSSEGFLLSFRLRSPPSFSLGPSRYSAVYLLSRHEVESFGFAAAPPARRARAMGALTDTCCADLSCRLFEDTSVEHCGYLANRPARYYRLSILMSCNHFGSYAILSVGCSRPSRHVSEELLESADAYFEYFGSLYRRKKVCVTKLLNVDSRGFEGLFFPVIERERVCGRKKVFERMLPDANRPANASRMTSTEIRHLALAGNRQNRRKREASSSFASDGLCDSDGNGKIIDCQPGSLDSTCANPVLQCPCLVWCSYQGLLLHTGCVLFDCRRFFQGRHPVGWSGLRNYAWL